MEDRLVWMRHLQRGLERRSDILLPQLTRDESAVNAGKGGGASIINEANLTGGENVGGSTAAPAAPEVASDDDDGDGDGDPDPERQTKRPRTSRKSTPPAAILARPKDACTLLGIGRTKLHHLSERDPRFPRKIVLGARCVGWRIDALHDYLRTCEREG